MKNTVGIFLYQFHVKIKFAWTVQNTNLRTVTFLVNIYFFIINIVLKRILSILQKYLTKKLYSAMYRIRLI